MVICQCPQREHSNVNTRVQDIVASGTKGALLPPAVLLASPVVMGIVSYGKRGQLDGRCRRRLLKFNDRRPLIVEL